MRNLIKTAAAWAVLIWLLPWTYWQAYKQMREMERDGVIVKPEEWGECGSEKAK